MPARDQAQDKALHHGKGLLEAGLLKVRANFLVQGVALERIALVGRVLERIVL